MKSKISTCTMIQKTNGIGLTTNPCLVEKKKPLRIPITVKLWFYPLIQTYWVELDVKNTKDKTNLGTDASVGNFRSLYKLFSLYFPGMRSYFSMRPRWWYFAIGNCDSQKGLYLEYAFLMTNANISNRWFYHFSFDEFCRGLHYEPLKMFAFQIPCQLHSSLS